MTVREGEEIVALDESLAELRLASGEIVRGDAVVVAAGAWVGRLLPEFATIPVMRQALVYVAPPPAYARAWAAAPALAAFGNHSGYILPGARGTDLKCGADASIQWLAFLSGSRSRHHSHQ